MSEKGPTSRRRDLPQAKSSHPDWQTAQHFFSPAAIVKAQPCRIGTGRNLDKDTRRRNGRRLWPASLLFAAISTLAAALHFCQIDRRDRGAFFLLGYFDGFDQRAQIKAFFGDGGRSGWVAGCGGGCAQGRYCCHLRCRRIHRRAENRRIDFGQDGNFWLGHGRRLKPGCGAATGFASNDGSPAQFAFAPRASGPAAEQGAV